MAFRPGAPAFPVDVGVSDLHGSGGRQRIGIIRDITERKQHEERLSKMANFDSLTGLPNRTLFRDCLGHDIGDKLLVDVAKVLGACVRDTDSVVRGDALDLGDPVTPTEGVFRLGGDEFITVFLNDGTDLDGLIKQADLAMYRSKELGRDTYFFFNAKLNDEAGARHRLETRLRHALERGEFRLHYQPKVDLATRRVTGVEALLRWQPAGAALVGPDQFIPLPEETGLIVPVGAWAIREACEQMMRWQRCGLRAIALAVNLSARQFRQHDLLGDIAQVLRETGFAASQLEIELTESMPKIDRSFVKATPDDPEDSAIAIAVVALGRGLGLKVVAEGVETVETVAQREFLRAQGCDELQGYLLSRPIEPAAFARWFAAHDAQKALAA